MDNADGVEAKIPTTEKDIVAALGLLPIQEQTAIAELIDAIQDEAKTYQTQDTFSTSAECRRIVQRLVDKGGPHIWGQEEREHLILAGSNEFYPKDLFYDDPSDYDKIIYLLTLLLQEKWKRLREDHALAQLSRGFTKLPGFNPPYTVTCFCSPTHDSHRKSPLLAEAWVGRLDQSAIQGLKPDGNASVDDKETFNEVLTLYLSQTDDFTKTYGPRTLKPKSARTDERQGYCAACYKHEKLDELLNFKQISFSHKDKIWIYPFERNGELLFHILGSGNKSHFGEYRFWLGPGRGYIEDRFILVAPQRQPRHLKESSQASYKADRPEDAVRLDDAVTTRSHQRNTLPQNSRQVQNGFRAVNVVEPFPAMSVTPSSTPRDEIAEPSFLQSSAVAGEKRKFSLSLNSRPESSQQPPTKTHRPSFDIMYDDTPPPHKAFSSMAGPNTAPSAARSTEDMQIILKIGVEGVSEFSVIDITRCTGVDDFFAKITEELEDEIPDGGAVKSVVVTFPWDSEKENSLRIRRGNSVSFAEMMRTVWEAPDTSWTGGRCKIVAMVKIQGCNYGVDRGRDSLFNGLMARSELEH